jgi:hypothetical protein
MIPDNFLQEPLAGIIQFACKLILQDIPDNANFY